MRVWSAYEKEYLDYPATRWVCEWADSYDGPEDFNPDCLIMTFRTFGSRGKGLAIAWAEREGEDKCYMGSPVVYQESLEIIEGHVATWERVEDSEVYI